MAASSTSFMAALKLKQTTRKAARICHEEDDIINWLLYSHSPELKQHLDRHVSKEEERTHSNRPADTRAAR